MTNDQVWKAPVDAVEEFDTTMALRIAAVPAMPIVADSIEAYWEQWEDVEIVDPASVLEALEDEFSRLTCGEAHLRVSDGTRWILSDALYAHNVHTDEGTENRFLRRLIALQWEHKVLRSEQHGGPSLPSVLIQQDTLNVRRVFCTGCRAWRDLQADAEEADQALSPWEEPAEE